MLKLSCDHSIFFGSPIDFGIVPIKTDYAESLVNSPNSCGSVSNEWFPLIRRLVRLVKFPSRLEMVPLSRLLFKTNYSKFIKDPISVEIVPFRLLKFEVEKIGISNEIVPERALSNSESISDADRPTML